MQRAYATNRAITVAGEFVDDDVPLAELAPEPAMPGPPEPPQPAARTASMGNATAAVVHAIATDRRRPARPGAVGSLCSLWLCVIVISSLLRVLGPSMAVVLRSP
jgi:hypothetical protein